MTKAFEEFFPSVHGEGFEEIILEREEGGQPSQSTSEQNWDASSEQVNIFTDAAWDKERNYMVGGCIQ